MIQRNLINRKLWQNRIIFKHIKILITGNSKALSCQESSIFSQIDQDLAPQLTILTFVQKKETLLNISQRFENAPKPFMHLNWAKKGGKARLCFLNEVYFSPLFPAFFFSDKNTRIFWECHKIIDIMILVYGGRRRLFHFELHLK